MLRNIKQKFISKVPEIDCTETQEVNLLIEDCLSSKAEFESNVTIYLSRNQNFENKENKIEDEYLVANGKR